MDGKIDFTVPVTVYKEGRIQILYRSIHEALINRFTGDFQAFFDNYVKPEAQETLEGAELVKFQAMQAREALQVATWGLTEEAQKIISPVLDFLWGLEHASEPYLTSKAKARKMAATPFTMKRSCLEPASPDLIKSLLTLAGQTSYAIMARDVQEDIKEGDYETIEEAIQGKWGTECCCGIVYRFSDEHEQYDIGFHYVALSAGISQEVRCYTWEYQHPELVLSVTIDPKKGVELTYGEKRGSAVKSVARSVVQDIITILTIIRDDENDALHSIYKTFI
jgi:hypothetical protein